MHVQLSNVRTVVMSGKIIQSPEIIKEESIRYIVVAVPQFYTRVAAVKNTNTFGMVSGVTDDINALIGISKWNSGQHLV